MKRTVKMLLAGAALVPALSFADSNLSYNYVEAGYTRLDPDGTSDNFNGWALRGSLAIADMWHLIAEFNDVNTDGSDDLKTYRVGGGINWGLNDKTDLIGRVSWVRQDIGDARNGYGLTALVRGQIAPGFELEGGVDYVDFGSNEGGDTTSFVAAGRYFFTPNFAGGLNLAVNNDYKTYGLDLRYSFK